ncbi:hypothetical protein STIAU_6557, partial [Stigmatella aurantiaca DW4/3-1]
MQAARRERFFREDGCLPSRRRSVGLEPPLGAGADVVAELLRA